LHFIAARVPDEFEVPFAADDKIGGIDKGIRRSG
jgi:hypothetical protein